MVIDGGQYMYIKPEKKWLCRKEAAVFLTEMGCAISPRTLQNMASHNNAGGGPSFYRSGYATIRYDKGDLIEWAKSKMVKVE